MTTCSRVCGWLDSMTMFLRQAEMMNGEDWWILRHTVDILCNKTWQDIEKELLLICKRKCKGHGWKRILESVARLLKVLYLISPCVVLIVCSASALSTGEKLNMGLQNTYWKWRLRATENSHWLIFSDLSITARGISLVNTTHDCSY